MKTLQEMQVELQQIEEEIRNWKALLEQEDREPNEDERAKVHELLDRADQLDELIAMEKRRLKLEERFTEPTEDDKKKAEKVRPNPDDGQKEYRLTQRKPFKSMGEQMAAIMKAGMGQRIDPRLYEVEQRASGLAESPAHEGGFLLQDEFAAELIRVAFDTGILASKCRRMTLGNKSNSLKIPGIDETSRASTRWGGILAYWADEAELKTKSKPKFRRIELNLNKLVGLCYATDELLEDVAALEGYIRTGFAEEFGFQMDDAIVNGTGAGQPLGIMNAGCMVQVNKETGQAADTIVFENVTKMWSRLFAKSLSNSVWLINQDCWPELFNMYLAVGTGGAPVYLPPGGLSGAPYGTLMGRPVIPIEQCQTVGTSGDIILADFNGYIIADKGAMQTASSIHVRFIYDESVFRFVYRVDGQPIIASALTPFKGTNTQSFFVKLQSRD